LHPVTSNIFPEFRDMLMMTDWTFLTSHARALRGRNGALPDPVDDLGRFQQLRGGWP
jgi:hypothetical protein